MPSLRDIYRLGQDTALRERVLAAVVHKANFVLAESSPAALRLNLARQAVTSPESLVAPFSRQCADNGTIQAEAIASNGTINSDLIPDNDLIYVVDVTWNAVAGVPSQTSSP